MFPGHVRCTGRIKFFKMKVYLIGSLPWGRDIWILVDPSIGISKTALFSQNPLISFFKYCAWIWNRNSSKVTEFDILEKLELYGNIKKCQKWLRNRIFVLFDKVKSLVLSENGLKGQNLWPINIYLRLQVWKNCVF